eukprot:7390084-Prymnesium_polylepis.1
MVGAGRLRAEWNAALLQDVVAPSYVSLLLQVRERLRGEGGSADPRGGYYALWPHVRPSEPWGGLVDTLYQMLLQQPALYSELHGGVWVSPVGGVFAPAAKGKDAMAGSAMEAALLRSGMPLVRVPVAVEVLLQRAAGSQYLELRRADPPMVRTWLAAQREWEAGLTREEGMELLQHCLLELGDDVSALCGLRLLPLLDGSWGRFEAAEGGASPLLLCEAKDRALLAHRPALVVDVDVASALGQQLLRVAARKQTKLHRFSAALLPTLLPSLLPARWRALEVVDLEAEAEAEAAGEEGSDASTGGGGGEPRCGWLLQLWEFIGRHHAQTQLGELTGWPLLPAEGGLQAYALPADGLPSSRMVDLKDADAALSSCVREAGCLGLHAGASRVHPQLAQMVHEASACGILRALRVAAGGGGAGGADGLGRSVSRQFEGVGAEGRRVLRGMLAERRHVEERELRSDAGLVAMVRWLPVYEVHSSAEGGDEATAPAAGAGGYGGGVGAFVALDVEVHRLAPSDVAAALLDERFVLCAGADEHGLVRFAGVVQLERSRFYREHVFPRLRGLPGAHRDEAMLSVLHGLHALCAEDGAFLVTLREVAFVPVESGALRRACELFHPKVHEVAELLDRSEVHPSGAFADEAVLGVLERLGLRVQVTRDAVLESARSIEALGGTDADAA